MSPLRQAKGFTLVELAIALTIIGLIIGGLVLGGSAVMESARTSTLLGQIKDLAAASRDFKNRYGYFPGDLPNAGTLIKTEVISSDCDKPAAGKVGDGVVDTTPITESTCALEHLVKARMLIKVEMEGGNYVIRHPFGGGTVALGATAANENVVRVSNLPCNIALQIDGKLDNASTTPLAAGSGFVTGLDSSNASIDTCTPGGANDPVTFLLIRY
ncbi:MAG: prepilin-type N-terminal cleavage/methylation domain-containing protein [Rhodocyclaceae bacterium]